MPRTGDPLLRFHGTPSPLPDLACRASRHLPENIPPRCQSGIVSPPSIAAGITKPEHDADASLVHPIHEAHTIRIAISHEDATGEWITHAPSQAFTSLLTTWSAGSAARLAGAPWHNWQDRCDLLLLLHPDRHGDLTTDYPELFKGDARSCSPQPLLRGRGDQVGDSPAWLACGSVPNVNPNRRPRLTPVEGHFNNLVRQLSMDRRD